MKKGTKLYSIFRNRCPRCHEGQFFESKNPYDLKNMTKMPEECPVCSQKYTPETGFYYGAMYVSYALGVAIWVTIWVATSVLFPNITTFQLLGAVLTALLLMFPVTFRAARLIWANIFIKYTGKEEYLKQKQSK
ncbi:DUF983 domain-containing protein [Paracrocinitomix mangrovi]|uniref:DUF983 domain-containing protein n=1 Tax=Paracrocinitomix mangrovi TaxID=2862509 RepID=UPI001C8ECEEA|nr:DUF983 domain-containing protein [Paracrocinitomix mangrovi]UKN01861.1 DUF983 domain-containing protein [Paracrocinitomix mangrovi]